MQVDIRAGKYVVAVSGGVDSVVLLDALHRQAGLALVVAHFDHGIREDSAKDRLLVQQLAESHGVPFVHAEGRLGPHASEATAREARYKFLEHVRHEHSAAAIITAHHQDDVLETAVLNMLRGTGRRGLASLISTPSIIRPMLHMSKEDIVAYARRHGLRWREDSTNADERYLRNYIRHRLLARFDPAARERLLGIIEQAGYLNEEIDVQLLALIREQPGGLDISRQWFIQLPHSVAKEVLATWLRGYGIRNIDSKMLERITVAGKTLRPGAAIEVTEGIRIKVEKKILALVRPER